MRSLTMVVSKLKGSDTMIWFLLFLLCSVVAIVALLAWLGLAALQAFATCMERSLGNFSNGHVVVAILYTVLGGWFAYLVAQGIFLALSFCQAARS